MQKEEIESLIALYFEGKLDAAAEGRLIDLLNDEPSEDLLATFDRYVVDNKKPVEFSEIQSRRVWQVIVEKQQLSAKRKRQYYLRFAGLLLVFFSAALLVYQFGWHTHDLPSPASGQDEDVYLHQNGALSLQLQEADGDVRPLSQVEYRSYVEQSDSEATTLKFSSFDLSSKEAVALVLRTDKGQMHTLYLPDGTKIWLNSRTQVTVPLDFNQQERHLALNGEAYFEVAPLKEKRFSVQAKYNRTEVLGTHFNIYAYADEVERTSLVEGKVKVSNAMGDALLKVGEQAYGNMHKPIKTEIDTSLVRAWQQGYFVFNNLSIEELMSRVDDWYDIEFVDINYGGTARFSGTFKQSNSLKELLNHLEEISDIKFNIKQGGVHVMKR